MQCSVQCIQTSKNNKIFLCRRKILMHKLCFNFEWILKFIFSHFLVCGSWITIQVDDGRDPFQIWSNFNINSGKFSCISNILKRKLKNIFYCISYGNSPHLVIRFRIAFQPHKEKSTIVYGEESSCNITSAIVSRLVPNTKLMLWYCNSFSCKKLLTIKSCEWWLWNKNSILLK